MGWFSKIWGRRESEPDLDQFTLRLAVAAPSGETRHQFVRFAAQSAATAIEHARRRAQHPSVLRWKLFDNQDKMLAEGIGTRVREPETHWVA
jgi:hypothetical protein